MSAPRSSRWPERLAGWWSPPMSRRRAAVAAATSGSRHRAPVCSTRRYCARSLRTDATLLPLAVPVAVCEAAEAVAPVRCQVKWPNDVWVDERKVAGVLVEARPEEGWAVIGVGLNVAIPQDEFPPELRETADLGAAHRGGGRQCRRAARPVCAAHSRRSTRRWAAGSAPATTRCSPPSGPETRSPAGRSHGTAARASPQEIDERGHLVVERADGERVSLGAGEVHLAVGR